MTQILTDPLVALQGAQNTALTGDAVLQALSAEGVAIRDEVNGAPFPYVVIGEDRESPDDMECQTMSEVFSTVRAYSRAVGRVEVKQIAGRVRWLLDADHGFSVPGFKLLAGVCERVQVHAHTDDLTKQAELTFKYILVPIDTSNERNGAVDLTLAGVGVAGSADVLVSGALAGVLEGVGLGSNAGHDDPVDGVLAVSLVGSDLAASAAVLIVADVSDVLEGVGIAAIGASEAAAVGGLSIALSGAIVSGSGQSLVSGLVQIDLQAAGLAAGASAHIAGAAAIALEGGSVDAAGSLEVGAGAGLSVTLAGAGLAASGDVLMSGLFAAALDAAAASASGIVVVSGQASPTIEAATVSAAGAVEILASGGVAATLAGASMASAGTVASAASNEAETDALIARMSVAPSAPREAAINAVIVELKASGALSALDVLYLVGHDEQASFENWLSASYTLTRDIGTEVFVADGYWQSDAAGGFFDTDFRPSTDGGNWQLDSATMGFATSRVMGGQQLGTNKRARVQVNADKSIEWRLNMNLDRVEIDPVENVGIYAASSGASDVKSYKNGALHATDSADQDSNCSANVVLFGDGQAESDDGFHRVRAFFAGGALTDAQHLSINNAITAYLAHVDGA